LAERCQDDDLRQYISKFIAENLWAVRRCKNWRKLANGSFELVDRIFDQILMENDNECEIEQQIESNFGFH